MDPDWTTRVQRLEAEVAGLRHSLRTRGLIEQAKGILAERHGIDLEEAFRRLVHTSQQTNVRVVDVAADVVTAPRPGDEPPERRRSIARVRTATSTAEDPADLVTALYEEVAALGARAVAVHRARPEGGLRLLAAHGWPAQLVADWRSVPSALRTPGAEALRRGETLWLPDPGVGPLTLIGSGEHRTVLPVIVEPGGARPTVAVEFVWSRPVDRDDGALGHLHALAEAVAAWLRTAEHPAEPESGPDGLSLVAAAADAMPTPAVVLSPIDDGADLIVDYLVEHVNARGAGSWPGGGRSAVGRRLLDLEPALAAGVAMDGYAEAYRGEPQTCVAPDGGPDGCATRVGPALVVTWPGGDTDPTSALGPAMERMGGFGWAEWSVEGRPLVWSPGLDRLLGQAAASPLSLDRLLRLVVEEDRAALAAALRDAATLRDATTLRDVEQSPQAPSRFRVRTPAGPRHLSVVAARGGPGGRRTLTLFQDVTEALQREAEASRAAQRLAATRMQTAVERATAEELRAALFPRPESRLSRSGWRVAARHVAGRSINRFRGDFYEIMEVGAELVVVVGDVFGSGVAAFSAMIRLRHAARALTLAGAGPARTLELINQELAGDADPPMSSAVIAHLDAGTVTWAQAGHYSPVLVHAGRGRSLRRPRGDALGLIPDTRYTQSSAELAPGDVLVVFTDGVLNRGNGRVLTPRELTAALVEASTTGGADGIVRQFPRPAEDEACVVAVDWLGEGTG